MLKICIVGLGGRMGHALWECCRGLADAKVVCGIDKNRDSLPECVRDHGYDRHQHEAEECEHHLPFKEICGVPVLRHRLIGAGRIEHDQAKREQEQHNEKKTVIHQSSSPSDLLFNKSNNTCHSESFTTDQGAPLRSGLP